MHTLLTRSGAAYENALLHHDLVDQNLAVRIQHLRHGQGFATASAFFDAVDRRTLNVHGGGRGLITGNLATQMTTQTGGVLVIEEGRAQRRQQSTLRTSLARSVVLRYGGFFDVDVIPAFADIIVDDAHVVRSIIDSRVNDAVRRGQQEEFEYGIESDLARSLSSVILEYGLIGVQAIGDALTSAVMTDETACETLRQLGAVKDARTLTDRIRVLAQQLLHSASPRRRYAAAVGLADTNAPEAIRLLRKAIDREPTEELKRRFWRFIALLPH